MIRLNGFVNVDGKDMFFEDFEIEIDEDLDLPFDYLTDDEEDSYCNVCNDDCEDCELYENDDKDNNDETDIDELVDALTDVYAEELSDSCLCPECVKDLLVEFIRDFIDLL